LEESLIENFLFKTLAHHNIIFMSFASLFHHQKVIIA